MLVALKEEATWYFSHFIFSPSPVPKRLTNMKRIISLVMLSLFHCLKHLTSNPLHKYQQTQPIPHKSRKKPKFIKRVGGPKIQPTAGESRLLANLPSASFSDFDDNRVVARVDLEETSNDKDPMVDVGVGFTGALWVWRGNLGTRCPCFRAKWINYGSMK